MVVVIAFKIGIPHKSTTSCIYRLPSVNGGSKRLLQNAKSTIVLPMITQRQIETYAADVAREFRPLKIVLFGSYAYGNPTEDSDVDLMVVMTKDDSGVRNRERALAIRSAIPKSFPLDLLVRDPEDIAWRLEEGDCFLQDVFSKGRVLYETTHN